MGIDAGFDMSPRLTDGDTDRRYWNEFIRAISTLYEDDAQVQMKENYILFKAGECPRLPYEGHKFLRFSSNIAGNIARSTHVKDYINTVTLVAKATFGSRIHEWNECFESHGVYGWSEVNESFKSYAKCDDPKTEFSSVSSPESHLITEALDDEYFEIKNIPGKGRGLVARRHIPKGTRILCEQPLMVAASMPPNELEATLSRLLKKMPREAQRQFLSLHNKQPGKLPFSNIFKTNALSCGPDSPMGAVYSTICLINHSCIPNSHNNSWNSSAKHETIHAIRPIEAGEEITIPYNQPGASIERRAFLKDSFHFDCSCRACCLPAAELKASDKRRMQIGTLDEAIGDPFQLMIRPEESLKKCQLLLQLLNKEFDGYISVLDARVYFDAFQIAIAHGDQARASVFAERAFQSRITCEGQDSPAALDMKALALDPTKHASFAKCSSKWRTKRSMVPRGLTDSDFEKWLFRA